MTNPSYLPHLLGVVLDGTGVTKTQVIAFNRTTGERQIKATDGNKCVIFDAAEFTNGYSADDIIEFRNVGASVGRGTITINSTSGGFQNVTITCSAASTAAINM